MKIKALIKMINLHFWKSIFGPFFAFVFPIIFVGILGSLLGYYAMFGGMLLIASTAVSLTAMPQAVFEFKKSTLLKRIGVTPIKPWMFILMTGLFYVVVMILGTIFTLIMGIAIFSGNLYEGKEISKGVVSYTLSDMLAHVQWGGLIYGLLLNILVGTSIGLLIVSLTKSTLAIQGIGIPILILSQFLAGQVLPLNMIHGSSATASPMWWLGYISPFKSTTALVLQSFNPSMNNLNEAFVTTKAIGGLPNTNILLSINKGFNIFDINADYTYGKSTINAVSIFTKPERVLNLILPFAWIGLFSFITVKKFKWSAR